MKKLIISMVFVCHFLSGCALVPALLTGLEDLLLNNHQEKVEKAKEEKLMAKAKELYTTKSYYFRHEINDDYKVDPQQIRFQVDQPIYVDKKVYAIRLKITDREATQDILSKDIQEGKLLSQIEDGFVEEEVALPKIKKNIQNVKQREKEIKADEAKKKAGLIAAAKGLHSVGCDKYLDLNYAGQKFKKYLAEKSYRAKEIQARMYCEKNKYGFDIWMFIQDDDERIGFAYNQKAGNLYLQGYEVDGSAFECSSRVKCVTNFCEASAFSAAFCLGENFEGRKL